MTRVVKHTADTPSEVKTPSGDSVWICRCGLTTNEDGTCSGMHKKYMVADEEKDKLYCYKDGKRKEVEKNCCDSCFD